MPQSAIKAHKHEKQPDMGNDETAEFCKRAGDMILLSDAAEQNYCCCHPICSGCSNAAECRELAGDLFSQH